MMQHIENNIYKFKIKTYNEQIEEKFERLGIDSTVNTIKECYLFLDISNIESFFNPEEDNTITVYSTNNTYSLVDCNEEDFLYAWLKAKRK
jgi:hypothetical protein